MKTYHDLTGDGGSEVAEQVAAQEKALEARMASVEHAVAVMSGKGGVGKSTVAANLATALAQEGRSVGVVDADVNGPSLAKIMGVRDQTVTMGNDGMQPATGPLGIKVMSMDLFLPDDETPVVWDAPTQQDAYTWRGTMEAGAVREFLGDTEWGSLDTLLIDLPPGTDRLPTLVDLLPDLSGTIVVTIPSAVSELVVSKSIEMAREHLQTPVIGLVENMTTYTCPHCGEVAPLFPAQNSQATTLKVPALGHIPFDPRMAAAADEGQLFVQHYDALPASQALHQIAEKVQQFLDEVDD
jgi:ATP-binding protein involved in chromosome partitioning